MLLRRPDIREKYRIFWIATLEVDPEVFICEIFASEHINGCLNTEGPSYRRYVQVEASSFFCRYPAQNHQQVNPSLFRKNNSQHRVLVPAEHLPDQNRTTLELVFHWHKVRGGDTAE